MGVHARVRERVYQDGRTFSKMSVTGNINIKRALLEFQKVNLFRMVK